ncbi:MAG: hypothetical protein HY329_26510 [Chloroflexi bacterium]|nr:hypothetical protein [Chloroflexota bacterium]
MLETRLSAERYTFDNANDAIEYYFEKGWTDGLPVVPPTEEKVRAMLAAGGVSPDETLMSVPTRSRIVTAEKIAINAVMAGCKPEYFPVVLAAIEALDDPGYAVHGPAASTGSAATLLIVSGPVAKELDVNGRDNVLGPGWRANSTIGRTMRLVLMNCLGATPGIMDRSTVGNPAKYTHCIAEDWTETRWTPHHIERGFQPEDSSVTLCATESPIHINNHAARDAEGILSTYADTMTGAGIATVLGNGQWVIGIGPEHRDTIIGAGWSKDDVRNFIHDKTRVSRGRLIRAGRIGGTPSPEEDAKMVQCIVEPNDIIVVACGGPAGRWGFAIPGWSGRGGTTPTTKLIRKP